VTPSLVLPIEFAARTLSFEDVTARFAHVVAGQPERGLVPYFHFRIVTVDDEDVGHINFRVGDTEHIRLAAGHIGFDIAEPHRGHRYAFKACRAVAPLVRSFYTSVLLTCDPDNVASRRLIERLGATFVGETAVPVGDPHFLRGLYRKLRYRWQPQ
jgi:predicted acetyltransferase